MYCRICHYDLRGQIDPRCPECGTSFDPRNPRSFLAAIPIFRDRCRAVLQRLGKALRITTAVLVALMIPATYLLMPSLEGCRAPRYNILPLHNLQHVAPLWISQLEKGRSTWAIGKPGKDLAQWTPVKNDYSFEPRLSLYRHGEFIRAREAWMCWFKGDVAGFLVRIVIFGFIELFLLRGRLLRLTAVVVPVAFVLMLGCGLAARFVENIWPGDKSYLQDYAYVPPSKWTPVESLNGHSVIAYQVRGLTGRPVVAFENGGAGYFPEDMLAKAAREQGFVIEKTPMPE